MGVTGLSGAPGQTPLDPDEAAGLIPRLATQAELNDFEAINILEAVEWAMSSRQVRRNLCESETLKQLHRRMFNRTWKWAGTFRVTQKSIGVESWRISTEIKILLEDLAFWRESNTHPTDEIIARFHHRLVWIHCFPNGNGRHARLAADLLCDQLGGAPLTWGALQGTDARDRYLVALRQADGHDFKALTEFLRS